MYVLLMQKKRDTNVPVSTNHSRLHAHTRDLYTDTMRLLSA